MRIVIDMQGAQTASRFRGIGRYTMALTLEMVRLRGKHEVFLALNGAYEDSIEFIRETFASLLPKSNIRVFTFVSPVGGHDSTNETRRKSAEAMREAFLTSLEPDVILVSSLFDEFGGEVVTSIGTLDSSTPTAVMVYDLIPLVHADTYLQDPAIANWYFNKLDHLRRADLILTISEYSCREAIEYLNFPEQTVVSISTGCDAQFQRFALTESQKRHLRNEYGIDQPFVMYTGGADQRKNLIGLLRSYALLPLDLRRGHKLVLVGRDILDHRKPLLELAKSLQIQESELIFTGYVSDSDLILLYNACRLFVFPSWHEGFGLPILEAMACGRAAIAANASSLPEVLGREDALFPAKDDAAMALKIAEVLSNPGFRVELEKHGLEQAQKFSWKVTAQRAWSALETLHRSTKTVQTEAIHKPSRRPRLAYVSPLPPERSGIADYSSELLLELSRHYEIDVIIIQEHIQDAWARANTRIRSVEWFRAHAHVFDRVLYQFGNSPFHSHMFELIREIPGISTIHDFYLGNALAWGKREQKAIDLPNALLHGYGWPALLDLFREEIREVVNKYHLNLEIIQQSLGVVVHSEHSLELAYQAYGSSAAQDWNVIPLLRIPAHGADKQAARRLLKLPEDAFLICTFGFLAPNKLNDRLLAGWLASALAQNRQCHIVFVGENDGGDYGTRLTQIVSSSAAKGRIVITGWVDSNTYGLWLAAADAAVQLRTLSRGETSAAVLDCMNYGLPVIVNAHGSMAYLPAEAVWMLPDKFSDEELIDALDTLWQNPDKRKCMGEAARQHILTHHNPRKCADQYRDAIEQIYSQAQGTLLGAMAVISQREPALPQAEWPALAKAFSANFPPQPRRRQMFVDISALVTMDLHTGIQRVTRALLQEIALNPPEGWVIEPVFAIMDAPGYRYARRFMCRFLGIPDSWAKDEAAEAWPGDVFIGLDLQQHAVVAQKEFLRRWRLSGVIVKFVVYDLLPVLLPEVFPEGTQLAHQKWLETIAAFDGALCISRSVADELDEWLQNFAAARKQSFSIDWFHLGADVENSVPKRGLPPEAERVLPSLSMRPTFVMVGTIEPRKGYLQTLTAFEQLWEEGLDVNLVIVGSEGWKPLADTARRTIPQIVHRLRNCVEFGKRLYWLEDTSDEYLEKIYAASTCLIVASEGEGFGLPLIEAARKGLPLLVRDLPVFHEVTGGHASFFENDLQPETIQMAVNRWLEHHKNDRHTKSLAVPHQTWKDSARQVLAAALGKQLQADAHV
jgi:glycosyltransferase involved in cell wall biosynthesis